MARLCSATLLGAALLSACGPAPLRIAVPPTDAAESQSIGFDSVEVLEAQLPTYAEGEDIFVQGQGRALTQTGAIWADDPSRAFTLELTDALNDLTGARIAPDPWPFEEPAGARLDVRVAEFAPDLTRGTFLLRGQYFVAALDESGRDRAREFRVEAPLAPSRGPAAIAAARAQATVLLAREIASDGLR